MRTSVTGKRRSSAIAAARLPYPGKFWSAAFRQPLEAGARGMAGFTLLELLVVMVIIGIIAAMLTLSVGVATPDTSTDKEIERLENLVKLASEEAVLAGRELGITFYDKEYEFSVLDADSLRWTPIETEEPFGPHRFPAGSLVDLALEGRSVRLALEKPPPPPPEETKKEETNEGESSDEDEEQEEEKEKETINVNEPDPRTPQIMILSSGDILPAFELRLRPEIGGRGTRLRVSENGSVERLRDEI
jgi:general secretion pathway protein H